MTIRVYCGEDLPQMDPEVVQKVKKFFHVGTTYKDLVDPYCVIKFAGIKGNTRTIEHDQDPKWNQQLNFNVKASSGTWIRVGFSHLKLQNVSFTVVDYLFVVPIHV